MKKLLFLLVAWFGSCLTPLAWAQKEASLSPVLGEKKEQIEEIRLRIQKKVSEKLAQIVGRPVKRGWVGTIKEISPSGLRLQVREEIRQVIFAEKLTIIDAQRKALELEDLKPGLRVLVMGYLQNGSLLEARRIVVVGQRSKEARRVILAQIVDKSQTAHLLLVTQVRKGNKALQVKITSQSKIFLRGNQEGRLQKGDWEDLKVGNWVVAVLTPTKADFWQAKVVLTWSRK